MNLLTEILGDDFYLDNFNLNGWETISNITKIINSSALIIESIDYMKPEISTLCDYQCHQILNTIIRYKSILSDLKKDNDKEVLQKVIEHVDVKIQSFSSVSIYDFINKQYQEIFAKRDSVFDHSLISITMNHIFSQFSRVNSEVFKCFEEKYWSLILNGFNQCIKHYKKNINALDKLLSDIYENEREHPFSNICNFLLKNRTVPFIDIFEKHAIVLANKAIKLLKEINEDNYLEIYAFCESIIELARLYQLKKQLNDFDELKEKTSIIAETYMKKHGHQFRKEVDLKSLIDKLKQDLLKQEIPSNITFLQLTHKFENGLFIPQISSILNETQRSITDFVAHIGLKTSSKFSASVQTSLRMLFQFYAHLLGLIIKDNEISEGFLKMLSDILEEILKKYNIDNENINDEFNGIIDTIVYLYSIDEKYPYFRTICYGLCQTICSFIEKIMRKLFFKLYDKEKSYFYQSQITIGDLFKSNEIKAILGDDLVAILEYELHFNSETMVGLNLRNKLMHNNDIEFKNMHLGLVIHFFNILFIFIQQLEVTILNAK